MPLLRLNSRLADGFDQRRLSRGLPRARVWIQAASAGEAYLTREICRSLSAGRPESILATSNTRQGLEILNGIPPSGTREIHTTYFPFDAPSLMARAVNQVRPDVMVLLETEIWPGLLSALKKKEVPILIINGRLSAKSLKRYLMWPALRHLRPDRILAISEPDADRFRTLFGPDGVEIMPNIKFDRININSALTGVSLENLLGSTRVAVLGSVRKEEEPQAEKMICRIFEQCPEAVVALFPRHLHRIESWKKRLARMAAPWALRSRTDGPVLPGSVVLWDTFGELSAAYAAAHAVFVGGSLAPLGGQNFIEPLICGLRPVIGPSWEDFAWVGRNIFHQGLVRIGADWQEAADFLIQDLKFPAKRADVRALADQYVRERRGGTDQACQVIDTFIKNWPLFHKESSKR
jgi:3-deoxy-D-manno-octulosonic-acid transferase